MSSQPDSRLIEVPVIRPNSIGAFAQNGLIWIAGRPAYIKLGAAITLLFGLVVTIFSLLIGTSFSVPNQRLSVVLGISVVVPIGWAMATYLLVQGYQFLRNRDQWSGREVAGNLANDMILMALFIGANYLHFNLKGWVPLINPALFDDAYMASDESLRPLVDAFTWISNMIRDNLNPEVRWYQFVFLIMFIVTFCRFAAVRDALYPRFAISMLLMTCLGALSYLIAPALGPFIFEDGNAAAATDAQTGMYAAYQNVQAEGAAWITRNGSAYFTAALAAMPSLHVGYASLMTYYILKSRDYMAPLFVMMWLWVLIDSVALRWHYAIDAPAGIALCVLVIWLTNRLLARSEDTQPPEVRQTTEV